MEVKQQTTIELSGYRWTLGELSKGNGGLYRGIEECQTVGRRKVYGEVQDWIHCATVLKNFISDIAKRHDLEKLMEGEPR